jgi:hypothetical protein
MFRWHAADDAQSSAGLAVGWQQFKRRGRAA